MLNLATFLDLSASNDPESLCVLLDEHRMTFSEVAAAAKRVANILKAKGIGPGDKVAMMIPNTPHFPIIYYGILHVGAVVVPINILYQKNEIAHNLNDSESIAFFAYRLFEEQAVAAYKALETCRHFIIVGPPGDLEEPKIGDNLMPLVMSTAPNCETHQTMPDDTAVILYTSGTTATPKGAELSHFNLFFNAYICCKEINKINVGDRCLVTLPLFHSFGQTCLMNACIIGGGTMSLLPHFETRKAMEIIARDKINVLALVPTMYYYLLDEPAWKEYDFSSLKKAISGGSALPDDVHRRFKERYGLEILEGYGLSETSPVASFTMDAQKIKVGSVGMPIWGVEMGVMDENGTFTETEEVGEIVVRGHNVMKGYYNRPEATRDAIVDGWFHTGDMGKRDSDGYYYIVDRKKDLIIRSGMNIYPCEIEDILFAHPKVLEAAVIGIPDPSRGEVVKVYVTPKAGETLKPNEISSYLEERIAKFKCPKEVEVLSELPKGPTGKVLKRELRSYNADTRQI